MDSRFDFDTPGLGDLAFNQNDPNFAEKSCIRKEKGVSWARVGASSQAPPTRRGTEHGVYYMCLHGRSVVARGPCKGTCSFIRMYML